MVELINNASKDPNVKAILIHGGRFFSSGNELQNLIRAVKEGKEAVFKMGDDGVNKNCVNLLLAFDRCEKPLIAVVRGMAIGIGFTMLSLFDFVYVTPEAVFKVPFMQSC